MTRLAPCLLFVALGVLLHVEHGPVGWIAVAMLCVFYLRGMV